MNERHHVTSPALKSKLESIMMSLSLARLQICFARPITMLLVRDRKGEANKRTRAERAKNTREQS